MRNVRRKFGQYAIKRPKVTGHYQKIIHRSLDVDQKSRHISIKVSAIEAKKKFDKMIKKMKRENDTKS